MRNHPCADRITSTFCAALRAICVLGAFALGSPSYADTSRLPSNVQETLAQVGPGWGKDIGGNIAKTLAAFTPVLVAAPRDGVTSVRDLPYGEDARNKLDVFMRPGIKSLPVMVFLHGGAYVAGERNLNEEAYSNVPLYFARNGFLGVNATYRLAPAAKWPAAAQDVAAIVKWVKENAARYGGDPSRIYLMGHSAGATHVASYAFIDSLRPATPEVAGIILMSGRYLFDPSPDDPNLKNFQAYFGSDRSQYRVQSPISSVATAPRIPTFIVISEYDNPDLDTQGALLLSAYCQRDRACPRFKRLEGHNHLSMVFQFNSPDDELGKEVIDFVKRGR